MQVKIGDKIYSDTDQPILLVLSDRDKLNVHAMPVNSNIFCSHPKDMAQEDVKEFMKLPKAPLRPAPNPAKKLSKPKKEES